MPVDVCTPFSVWKQTQPSSQNSMSLCVDRIVPQKLWWCAGPLGSSYCYHLSFIPYRFSPLPPPYFCSPSTRHRPERRHMLNTIPPKGLSCEDIGRWRCLCQVDHDFIFWWHSLSALTNVTVIFMEIMDVVWWLPWMLSLCLCCLWMNLVPKATSVLRPESSQLSPPSSLESLPDNMIWLLPLLWEGKYFRGL